MSNEKMMFAAFFAAGIAVGYAARAYMSRRASTAAASGSHEATQ